MLLLLGLLEAWDPWEGLMSPPPRVLLLMGLRVVWDPGGGDRRAAPLPCGLTGLGLPVVFDLGGGAGPVSPLPRVLVFPGVTVVPGLPWGRPRAHGCVPFWQYWHPRGGRALTALFRRMLRRFRALYPTRLPPVRRARQLKCLLL